MAAALSAGLVLGSVGTASAATVTPTPTASSSISYADQMAAYKSALIDFRIAMQKYNAEWKNTLATYRSALKAFTTKSKRMYEAKRNEITKSFRTAIKIANSTFAAAMKRARTSDQRNAAKAAFNLAISTAASIRTVALDALDSAILQPVKPTPPMKPVAPIKPTKVEKSAKKVR